MKNSSLVDFAQIALMTACIIVLGFIPGIPLGFIPVPIVLQNLGILLAGIILGPRKGFASVALFLLMALVGLPVLTGQSGGPAQFIGPSSGYLYAWLITPLLIGFTINHLHLKHFSSIFIITWIFGVAVMDLTGACWLAVYTHTHLWPTIIANLVFVPGDTIKAILAAWIGPQIARHLR